ncbi:MAG: hypothetical protein L3J03_08175 [Desulfobacterales bacterium]|nr:hypothetical protein [Desulfobacterales bacterium]
MKMEPGNRKIFRDLICLAWLLTMPLAAAAASGAGAEDGPHMEWGGHLTVRAGLSRPGADSFYAPVGTGDFIDNQIEFRLKNLLYIGNHASLETHYELLWSGGDTRRKQNQLGRSTPGVSAAGPEDDRLRLFDLSYRLSEDNDQLLYHRLDRLVLTLQPAWGSVSLGRQALTWGNGLLFNPMDLFNPFAPTDIQRDYKTGDDMAVVSFSLKSGNELQLLAVVRRNPAGGKVDRDHSSLAAKYHFSRNTAEYDLMAASHYRDAVLGLGRVGYIGDAAVRLDGTWTMLNSGSGNDNFFSLVANLDYSWVWLDKNYYGLVEFFFNGLGGDRYTRALADPDMAARLARGELYTLGRTYLAGELRVELHPLFNLSLTAITNLADPSGLLQPRGVWDLSQSTRLTCGAIIPYGRSGTEYGGFRLPDSRFNRASAASLYLWLTWYY